PRAEARAAAHDGADVQARAAARRRQPRRADDARARAARRGAADRSEAAAVIELTHGCPRFRPSPTGRAAVTRAPAAGASCSARRDLILREPAAKIAAPDEPTRQLDP